jgi:AraC-like DNA-binding protein
MAKPYDIKLNTHPHIEMFSRNKYASRVHSNKHKNNGIEICYSYRGVFHWEIEGVTTKISKGECSVTLPWQKHGAQNDMFDLGDLAWIIIVPENFSEKGQLQLGEWSSLPLHIVENLGEKLTNELPSFIGTIPELPGLFKEVYNEFSRKSVGYEWRVNRLVDDLLLSLLRAMQGDDELKIENTLSIKFKKLVNENISKQWAVSDLAENLFLSRSSLSEKLRQETGYPPMEYLNQLRIGHAKKIMLETKGSITDVALQCGFSTSQYFASVFKKWEGVSPTNFKEKSL